MASDYPLEDERLDTREARYGSVLDRRLSLSLPASRWIVAAVALLAALLLRVPGLNRWSLTAEEAETALAGWNLVKGNDVASDLFGRPFLVEWTALFTFIGHASDSVVRMSVAVAGVALIALVLLFSRWLGPLAATSSAVLIALSPTMIANSRRIDGGMVITFLVLTFVALVYASRDRSSPAWPVSLGVVAALMVLSGPLGIAALLLALLAAYLLVPSSTHLRPERLLPAAASFAATYVVLASVFFARPGALIDSTAEIFGQLFGQHLANIGDRFHVPFVNLLVNEPLLLALAIFGMITSQQRELTRALGIWTVAALLLVSMLGTTGIAGHALVVLPLALLAGVGVAALFERLPWGLLRRGPGLLFIAALILLFFAVLSLIGLVTPEGGLTGWDWLAKLALVVLIVVLPLAVFISWVSPRLDSHHLVLAISTVLLLLSVVTFRSAVLAASERPGEPTDPLAQGAIAPSLPAVVDRIERLSVDLTRTERTVQDPTGGHGLRIAVDEQIEYPLAWYFRDFPNLNVFEPDENMPLEATQVAFLAGSRSPEAITPAMEGETYLYRYDSPEVFSDPDWGDLLGSVFSISDWRHFWGYLVDRTEPAEQNSQSFYLMLAPALAERLFGPTGPFALEDAAGAGTEGGQFSSPRGIAVADDGTTYVVDSGNNRIQVFDAEGEFQFMFGEPGTGPGQLGQFTGGQGGAGGIAVTEDRVYLADTWNHRIQVFDRNGLYLSEWGAFYDAVDDPAATGENPGQFYGPRDIAIYNDRVFVTDTGNERVQVFDLEGNFQTMWGSPGNAEGQLLEPVGITVYEDVVYVADSHNARVARFGLDGEPLGAWRTEVWDGLRFFEPYLAVVDEQLFATTSATGEVLAFDLQSGNAEPWPVSGALRPFGIAALPDGTSGLITDGIRNAVLQFDVDAGGEQ